MPVGRRAPLEVISQMTTMRSQGMTYQQIANEIGFNRRTVSHYLTPGLYQKHRERQRKAWREKRSLRRLLVKGKYVTVIKRPKPDLSHCELCLKKVSRLEWHHWDDNYPEQGLWLCNRCHKFCECLEYGLGVDHIEKYSKFKEIIKC